jgi:hypothetical protein
MWFMGFRSVPDSAGSTMFSSSQVETFRAGHRLMTVFRDLMRLTRRPGAGRLITERSVG